MQRMKASKSCFLLALMMIFFVNSMVFSVQDSVESSSENLIAIKKILSTIRKKPKELTQYLELAKYYLWESNELKAVEAYEKYLNLGGKKSEKILKTVANIHSWNGNLKKSLYWTQEFNTLFSDIKMQLHEARLLNWTGNSQLSLEKFQTLLDKNPSKYLEDIIRDIVEIMKFSDSVKTVKLIRQYAETKNRQLNFFLQTAHLEVMLNLKYSTALTNLTDELVKSWSFLNKENRFYINDSIYAADQLFNAGKVDIAFNILVKISEKMAHFNGSQIAKVEFQKKRCTFSRTQTKSDLNEIRKLALKKGSIRDTAEFYLKNEKVDKELFFFFLEYKGIWAKSNEYLFKKSNYFYAEGPNKLAKKAFDEMQDGLLKEKLFLLMMPERKSEHAEKILFEYDIYDETAFKYLENNLGQKDFISLKQRIKKIRSDKESENIFKLKKRFEYFQNQESVVELAKNLSWSGKKDDAIKLLEKYISKYPKHELPVTFLYELNADIILQSAEISIRDKKYYDAKKQLAPLKINKKSPSYDYYSSLLKQTEFYTKNRYRFQTSYFSDTEDITVFKRKIEMFYPLERNSWRFELDLPTVKKTDEQEELLKSFSADYIIEDEKRKFTISGNYYDFPESSIFRLNFDFNYRNRFWLHNEYNPILDTPNSIKQGLVKKKTGLGGKFSILESADLTYKWDILGYSDGNSGTNQRLDLIFRKFPLHYINLAFEYDYLDHKSSDNEDYYSPKNLKSYSYGLNIQPLQCPAFISLRKNFTSDKNSGYSIYCSAPLKLNNWTINLEMSYSTSVSGRFSNSEYKSKYIGVSVYEEL